MSKEICKADIRPTKNTGIIILGIIVLISLILGFVFFGGYDSWEGRELWWYFDFYGLSLFSNYAVDWLGWLLLLAHFFPIIILPWRNAIANGCALTLEEERIYGHRRKLFSTAELNLPIDKIDSIMITENLFNKLDGGETVVIRSTSGIIKFPWVQNAGQFVGAALEKIENHKVTAKAPAPAPNSDGSTADKIAGLKKLLDQGLISQEEFDQKRQELLAKM